MARDNAGAAEFAATRRFPGWVVEGTMEQWNPGRALSEQEQSLMKRLGRTWKLFAFLRRYRDALFDEAFQTELALMYRDSGA